MPFSHNAKEEALVKSRRCCCVCHQFAGRDCNVHHIVPESENGPNTLDNAIVLCPRCHAEAGHYNPKHPLGNKYSRSELRKHRNNWWKWCEENSSNLDDVKILPRITSGYEIMKMVRGAQLFRLDHDNVETEEQAQLIAHFLDYVQETGEILDECPPGAVIEAGLHADALIGDLGGSGFHVFGNRSKERWHIGGMIDNWTVVTIVVIHERNPSIIRFDKKELLPSKFQE